MVGGQTHAGVDEQERVDAWMPEGVALPASFFSRTSSEVAADLVGKILWRAGFGGGRLSEVEAYLPVGDPASHSAPGLTRRNAAMFGHAGDIYVFLSYGMHHLLNFVCDEVGVGSAVLVRAYEPLQTTGSHAGVSGARGPGVVGRALGIGLELSGRQLGPTSGVLVLDDGVRPLVARTPRIGISKGRDLLLRHHMVGSSHVSGQVTRSERGHR